MPTSKTTKHIAKTPTPEHGINAKGQALWTDKLGTKRWINMKEGRVKGPMGVPVKPEKG